MSSKKNRSSKSSSLHAFRDEDRVGFNAYPEELPIYLSHTNFPTSGKYPCDSRMCVLMCF